MRPEVVLVTGSREWTDRNAIQDCLLNHREGTVLIHGGCRGADKLCGAVGKELGFVIWELPYFEDEQGNEARNASMVAVAAAFRARDHKVSCYAFPLPGGFGTQKTMRLMRTNGFTIRNWSKQ